MTNVPTNHLAMSVNDVFQYKVCINLARRPERWRKIQDEFARHDIRGVRRFEAFDGRGLSVPSDWSSTPGAYGCLLSHLQVVRTARQLRTPSVLILEDDVAFDSNLQKKFSNYFNQAPGDWDMLYFGALHMEDPIPVSEDLCRIRRAYSTYAYAVNETVFDHFIAINENSHKAVDFNNLALQSERKCYCFMPHLAWVETNDSDAQGRQIDHWYLRESLVIKGASMDRLLARTSLIMAHSNPARSEWVTRNLLFLVRFYRERLPGMEVIVVEQSLEPEIRPDDLPAGCRYLRVRTGGPLNKGLCFHAGVEIANPENSFLIFSDSDIFVEEWDLCANMRMCERYDYTTGFGSIMQLTEADTHKLHDDRALLLRWFDAKQYSLTPNSDSPSKYYIFNRSAIQAAGGWSAAGPGEPDPLMSLKNRHSKRIFESPNRALRLHHE